MPKFFIDRPIFAWVVAIFIILAGAISISRLPIEQYPQVAPPTINLSVTYAGADAQTIDDSVISLIEREMNGVDDLDYMESTSLSNGTGSITLTFKPGTDADIAQVNVQNKLAGVTSRLPAQVRQTGVTVDQRQSNFLMFIAFTAADGNISTEEIGDYAVRNVQPELQRLQGVGNVQIFGGERAMRIWLDVDKLRAVGMTSADVNAAVTAQNTQVSAGSIGDLPIRAGQQTTATIVVPGQLKTVEEFENIILRSNTDGSAVRLKDVAKVELGSQQYAVSARLNGKEAVGMGIQLSTGANALETSKLVQAKMQELAPYFPAGMHWEIPYDSSTFVGISIEKVVHTLIEAIVLVFFVMLLFLQNIRYTIIPTIVVPIALLGALATMLATGMSINVLSMFAMVLVIGIVVDDAIVVVENVERIMMEEKLSPAEATKKAMTQITGAVVGITLVLISVFIPMAFFSGSTGNIYRQFSIVMAVSIFFSAFMALSLTPALCATILKPIEEGHENKKGFFGWFNRKFTAGTKKYESGVAKMLRRSGRMLVIYVLLGGAGLWIMSGLQSSFLPDEDQGVAIALVQLPAGATTERTEKTFEKMEEFALKQPEVDRIISVLGFSFTGQGQNMGLSFIKLKDWSERSGAEHSSAAVAGRLMGAMSAAVSDGFIFALNPPAIQGLGTSTGFSFRLEDRGAKGHAALSEARDQLLNLARGSKIITGVRFDGMDDAPQLQLTIDRDTAAAQGVDFSSIASVLSASLGSNYINDFPNSGRMQRVIVQADAADRMSTDDIMKLTVSNAQGQSVPLAGMVTAKWITGPMQTMRYNGYPAMSITGNAAEGYSSGDAIKEMERLAAQLPSGFGYEWTALSREELAAGSQSTVLYLFSVLAVFLLLAALYESWSIPFAVLLVVPLGLLGVALGVYMRGMSNDIYFQVGMITVIGLSAKNAILIVEFAKDLQAQGLSPVQAALSAAHLRFRPIIMTSLAFIMGVVPLYFASGASSASQRAIGTSVFWGMLIGTCLAVFLVPVFYSVVRTWVHPNRKELAAAAAAEKAGTSAMSKEESRHSLEEAEQSLSEEDRRWIEESGKNNDGKNENDR